MKSETITKLAEALSKAQGEMPAAEMNATNPFLKNKYADLGSIIKAAQPVMKKYGLSITQLPTSNNGDIGVTTILMHESGEYIEETIYLPLGEEKGKSLAQVAGSVITYLRRYSYASILGMYADQDIDGHQPAPAQKAKPAPKQTERPLSPDDLLRLLDLKAIKHAENNRTANDKQRGLAASMLNTCYGADKDKRYAVTLFITGGQSSSMSEVTDGMVLAILDWLNLEKDDDGSYVVGQYVNQEAQMLYNEALKAQGQEQLPLD